MSVYNKISAGFFLGTTDPITAGIEDQIFIFNKGDFTFTYANNNPLLITGITAVGGAMMYSYDGTNNSFNATSKLVKTSAGPRYTEEIDYNIAGISTALKAQMQAQGYGRMQCITFRNWKTGDSVFELWGAENGLILGDSENTANNETVEGGYTNKLMNPDKIREPYPPRGISIPPVSGSATYASTLAAIMTLVSPT